MAPTLIEIATAFGANPARIEKMTSQGHFAPKDAGGARKARIWTDSEALHVGLTLCLADRGVPVAEAAALARDVNEADFNPTSFLVVWRQFWVGVADPLHPAHYALATARLGTGRVASSEGGNWLSAVVDATQFAAYLREHGPLTIIPLGDFRSQLADVSVD